MKFLKAALAATAVTAFATSVQAQEASPYINVGVQSYEFDFHNVVGRVGYNFSENFGIEAEASFAVSGEKEEFEGVEVETTISSSFAAYLVGRYPVSEQFDLFGRVGYASITGKFTAKGNGFDESDSGTADGFGIGGGVQFNLDDSNGIRLGYTTLEGDGASGDVFDLVYVRKF